MDEWFRRNNNKGRQLKDAYFRQLTTDYERSRLLSRSWMTPLRLPNRKQINK